MKKIRIIPCLDMKEGKVVKGINFVGLQEVGEPVELAKYYEQCGAEEITLLNIDGKIMFDTIEKVAKEISIPITVGGGIKNIEDCEKLFNLGVSKISINSVAVKNPYLIKELSLKFGKEKIIIAIDVKGGNVIINGGKKDTKIDAVSWAKEVEKLGAGEILLTSMDKDGTKNGYDLEITRLISESVDIPVTASGGAGKKEDFLNAFTIGKASAVLGASVFHFNEINIKELKQYLDSALLLYNAVKK